MRPQKTSEGPHPIPRHSLQTSRERLASPHASRALNRCQPSFSPAGPGPRYQASSVLPSLPAQLSPLVPTLLEASRVAFLNTGQGHATSPCQALPALPRSRKNSLISSVSSESRRHTCPRERPVQLLSGLNNRESLSKGHAGRPFYTGTTKWERLGVGSSAFRGFPALRATGAKVSGTPRRGAGLPNCLYSQDSKVTVDTAHAQLE